MKDIESIYKLLNWENSREAQEEGYRLAKEINDLSLLIMPPAPPSVWESCAKILSEKTDTELEPYLDDIFKWLFDLNLPGALIILDRLKIFSGKILKKYFENRLINTPSQNKDVERIWLSFLDDLHDNEELIAELPSSILEKLGY